MADIAKKWKLAGAGVAALVLLSLAFVLLANYSSRVRGSVSAQFSKKGAIWAVAWRLVANVNQVWSRC